MASRAPNPPTLGSGPGWGPDRSDRPDRSGLMVSGDGYEYYRHGDQSIAHHRLLSYAWGLIDDLDDARDIDHCTPLRWLNVEWNLDPKDKQRHAKVTSVRLKARSAGQRQLDLQGDFV